MTERGEVSVHVRSEEAGETVRVGDAILKAITNF